MNSFSRLFLSRSFCKTVAIACLGIAVIGAFYALRVKNDDNLLAFLPQDNREVRTFYEINQRFGGLDVALVGIESDDPLQADFLERLDRATRELKETSGISNVLSLANITDFSRNEADGGIVTAPLLSRIPRTMEEKEALKKLILSREHVAGNLYSRSGRAVLLYCFLAYGTEPRAAAARIRSVVEGHFPKAAIYWGGNPFISAYVYDTVQKDIRRLTPWVGLVIILLMLLFFRDLTGTLLALLSTCMAIAVTVGVMGAFDVRLNLMLGSMPIVLFAIGCAYSIHILARYYDLRAETGAASAVQRTLSGIGPVVLVSGVTSAAAILSFMMMDIQPIRMFGLFTALGILLTMGFALTFVPAALGLFELKERRGGAASFIQRAFGRLAAFNRRRRIPVGVALVVVSLVAVGFIGRIRVGVDQSSFFSPGSPPDQADRFLKEHFGAAQFVQVLVKGDMFDPAVLAEVQALADRFQAVPHVTAVEHVGQIVALLNEAMIGEKRLPDTREQVQNLYTFIIGDASAAQLVSSERDQALLQLKVDESRAEVLEGVLAELSQIVEGEHLERYELARLDGPRGGEARERQRRALLWRLRALSVRQGVALPADTEARLGEFLDGERSAADPKQVAAMLNGFLRSGECPVELPPPGESSDPGRAVAERVAALGPHPSEEDLTGAVAASLRLPSGDDRVLDLAAALENPLAVAFRTVEVEARARALAARLDLPAERPALLAALSQALLDADRPVVLLPASAAGGATGSLVIQVNGLPVLHRGLGRSVQHNQVASLTLAVLLVVALLAFFFRSLATGVLAALPTFFTLLVIHGLMGAWRINLDIGTSLLGSLILANGVDYAVHLISAWHVPPGTPLLQAAELSAQRAGPAIGINAAAMFTGFFVLAMGEAKPLQNVSSLKAAAMLVGALASLFIVPLLARKTVYPILNEEPEAEPGGVTQPLPAEPPNKP